MTMFSPCVYCKSRFKINNKLCALYKYGIRALFCPTQQINVNSVLFWQHQNIPPFPQYYLTLLFDLHTLFLHLRGSNVNISRHCDLYIPTNNSFYIKIDPVKSSKL